MWPPIELRLLADTAQIRPDRATTRRLTAGRMFKRT
jgi:hypothetical protein